MRAVFASKQKQLEYEHVISTLVLFLAGAFKGDVAAGVNAVLFLGDVDDVIKSVT